MSRLLTALRRVRDWVFPRLAGVQRTSGAMLRFHNAESSLWMATVDEVVNPKGKERPDMRHPMVREAAVYAWTIDSHTPEARREGTAVIQQLGAQDVVTHCSTLAMKAARARLAGDLPQAKVYEDQLASPFTTCDPAYLECVTEFVKYFRLSQGNIPYRSWQTLDDYVIEDALPTNGRVALVGDWGTGQPAAAKVIQQIAAKDPHVVVHLGDIYYAGTQFEVDNYFLPLWRKLDIDKRRTFTLSGNHDMFSGGEAYYKLIDELGQPASFFCIRNEHWQLIGLDTGYKGHDPFGGMPTELDERELEWLEHKLDGANGRKTILMSHHPLFTAKQNIDGGPLDLRLYQQVKCFLPRVTRWFWGHEHDLIIYDEYQGVRARCIGHGAFPVGRDEPPKVMWNYVPLEPVALKPNGAFYQHGYALLELDGPKANVSYWVDDDPSQPIHQETV